MKTATVTFHAAHNYGAMLQAYAFQQFLFSLGVKNELIDLRIPELRHKYPYPSFDGYSFTHKIIHLFDVLARRNKYRLFETFLSNDLVLTGKVYETSDSILELDGKFDYFISAGDQIWNPKLFDWTPAYYLSGIKSKHISYAVSMGHTPEDLFDNEERQCEIGDWLSKYEKISVRELRTAKVLEQHFGLRSFVNLDTACLLSSENWSKNEYKSTIKKLQYKFVLAYSPSYNSLCNRIGAEIGNYLHVKTILTTPCPFGERRKYKNLRMKQKTGPWEFLWLVKHSEFVLCTSYHAVIFSLIFHKPFFFLDTKNDSRVHHLLDMVGMSDRIVTPENYKSKLPEAFDISFNNSDKVIEDERNKSRAYLVEALGLTQ